MKSILKSKSTKIVITLLLCILTLLYISTIAYSAMSRTINITGTSIARIEKNVRITNFSLHEVKNSLSMYEEYSANTILTEVDIQSNSYIIYNLEITNYGTTDIGILEIKGVPEQINYQIEGYNLKDKICDENGKCNSLAIRTYKLKISTNDIAYKGKINLEFDFRNYHTITYTNFSKDYTKTVMDGDNIVIDLSIDSPQLVNVISDCFVSYSYTNNIIKLNNVSCDIEIEALLNSITEFPYTGNYQEFIVPYNGLYKIELWGAKGNDNYNSTTVGALGAYTSGEIQLTKDEKLYVYVGAKGSNAKNSINFNNGTGNEGGFTGGGATDIRLISGDWTNTTSINSRIMVAAGGGVKTSSGTAGAAGGLIGYAGGANNPGTQTKAGTRQQTSYEQSTFGISNGGCTSGNGYYPGGGATCATGSSGGSSFISGHNGCIAITSETSRTPRNDSTNTKCADGTADITCSYHYSGYRFYNTIMIDGQGYQWTTEKTAIKSGMPTFDGKSTMTGNNSSGYAKITLISSGIKHSIKYNGIKGEYQNAITPGENLVVDFKNNAPDKLMVFADGISTDNFTYENGILTVFEVTNNLEIATTPYMYVFNYSGNARKFIAPCDGIYKIELWGASGTKGQVQGINSIHNATGASGGYTSGTIELKKNTELYIYVGQQGLNEQNTISFNSGTADSGGWNGGGATDVRLVSGTWNLAAGIMSRIMIAAGGGTGLTTATPGAAGGLVGYSGRIVTGGTQTSYGTKEETSFATSTFGIANGGCTGGNGYYPSSAANCNNASGGGSSFISGHNGCVAISSSTSKTPRNDSNGKRCKDGTTDITCSYHYSNYIFTDTIMIDGEGYNWTTSKGSQTGMPTHDGTSTMTGNKGNGHAKITLLEIK